MSYTGAVRILDKPAFPELLKRIPPKVVRTMQVAHSIWRSKQSTLYASAPFHRNFENKNHKGRKRKFDETGVMQSRQYKRKSDSSMILQSSVSQIAVVKDKIELPCLDKASQEHETHFSQITKPKIWQPQLQEKSCQGFGVTLKNSLDITPSFVQNHGFKQNNGAEAKLNDAHQPLKMVALHNISAYQIQGSNKSASLIEMIPNERASRNYGIGEINKSLNQNIQRTNVIVKNDFVQRPARPSTVDLTKEEEEVEKVGALIPISSDSSNIGQEIRQIIPTPVPQATETETSLHSMCLNQVPAKQGFSTLPLLNSSTFHQNQFKKDNSSMGVPLIDLRELNPMTSTLLEGMGFCNFLPAFYAALGNKIITIEAFVKNSENNRNRFVVRR